jgi:hypothetical protein
MKELRGGRQLLEFDVGDDDKHQGKSHEGPRLK